MSNRFNHFLNFKSLPSVGRIQVSEPMGFDACSYKVKREAKRFGRDKHIANEKQELIFTRENFELLSEPQYLPNGNLFNHASQGFYFIKDIYENEGGEGEIEYIIQDAQTETDFVTGIFDMYTINLDFNEITVSIVQNTNRETFKRLEDTDIDAFSVVDLEGNAIAPCPVQNVLVLAKPIIEYSKWDKSYGEYGYMGIGKYYTISLNRQIAEYGINNTVTAYYDVLFHPLDGVNRGMTFEQHVNGGSQYENSDEGQSTKLIIAQSQTTSIKVRLKFKGRLRSRNGSANSFVYYIMKSVTGSFFNNYQAGNFEKVLEIPLTSTSFTDVDLDVTFSSDIFLGSGEILYGGYTGLNDSTFIDFFVFDSSVEITATETSIDTISPAIRVIDLYKHAVHSIVPTMTVIAPAYDVGGTHYDNFCFNGLLLGQITDKPFKNQFKDLNNIFRETCSDYQINENTIEVLPYRSYFNDVEMAVFGQTPSNEKLSTFNPIYALKNAEFKYNKSSSGRETNAANTIDDIHTETQKLFPTRKTDNILKEEIKHIRSNYLFEEARRRAFDNKETASLQNDDDLFIKKCVPMPPSRRGSHSGILNMRILANGNLQILNNNEQGDGISFNWMLLGINTGGLVIISSPINQGDYTVVSMSSSVLELHKVAGLPTVEGDVYVSFNWSYTNVSYVSQTNEGYTLVEGVASPNNFGNLDYTWARNIVNWYPYLATASKFLLNKFITTTSFKINGNLRTQKFGETTPLGDSDPISTTAISTQKVLNPHNHKIKVYADFATMTQLINDIAAVKGYVTVRLNDSTTVKGFIYDLDYVWVTEELTISIEEKYISDFVDITNAIVSGENVIFVDEVGKEQKSGVVNYIIDDIFVILYNDKGVALNDPTRFTKFKINGASYADKILFCQALDTLIEL